MIQTGDNVLFISPFFCIETSNIACFIIDQLKMGHSQYCNLGILCSCQCINMPKELHVESCFEQMYPKTSVFLEDEGYLVTAPWQITGKRVRIHFYRPQTKLAKVMFLHLSVSHSVHRGEVCLGPGPGVEVGGSGRGGGCPGPHPGGSQHALRQTPPPPADGYCCKRYSSYWNAFLYYYKIEHAKEEKYHLRFY